MKTTIIVNGTSCHSCKALIEDVVQEIRGVVSCTVDYNTGKTEIECDKQSTLAQIKKEIESLGKYKVDSKVE